MKLKAGEKNQLNQYLDEIDFQISDRGYEIFDSGGCEYVQYLKEENGHQFSVLGNIEPYYEVFIFLQNIFEPSLWDWGNDSFELENYECDCIFFEENHQCKHVAAAIHFLIENGKAKKSTISTPAGKKSKTDLPLSIECNPASPEDFLNKLGKHAKGLTYSLQLDSVELEENTIFYFLSDYGHQYELSKAIIGEGESILSELNKESLLELFS